MGAFDILVGLGAGTNSLIIHDREADEVAATMQDDISITPSFSFRFSSDHDSGFGYFFELDFNAFDIDKQYESGDISDYGTSMSGVSTFFVPSIYYEFNNGGNSFAYRVGGGVGVGLLFLTGDFQVTKSGNSRYGETIRKTRIGLGNTYGVFFEVLNDDHSIVLQSYGPNIEDDQYRYIHQKIELVYRYIISF